MKRAPAVFASALLLCAPLLAAPPAPNGVLNPVWTESFRFLAAKLGADALHLSAQPYRVEEAAAFLRRARRSSPSRFDRGLAESLLRDLPLSEGELHLSAQPGASEIGPPHLNGAFRFLHPSGAELIQEARIAPASAQPETLPGAETAQFRTRSWNPFGLFPDGGYAADFTRSSLSAPVAGIRAALGRQPLHWGPGRSAALLLSSASPSLEGAFLSGRFGAAQGHAAFAVLNRIWRTDGPERYLARRYFSAHRLSWKPSPSLEIGAADAILYGGDLRPLEIRYLNPLLPFYASQFNAASESSQSNQDDNAMGAADIRWRPADGSALYAELLIDDLRYDPESNDPQALAWIVGYERAGWREKGEWSVEYSRVQRFVYTHLVQENRYTHYGRSLGHFLGNDSDLLRGSFRWFLTPLARVSAVFEQRRKGDSDVNDRYRGEKDLSFLKGGAETIRAFTLGGWARLGGWHLQSGLETAFRRGEGGASFEWKASVERTFSTSTAFREPLSAAPQP